jgi:hypothetical protein
MISKEVMMDINVLGARVLYRIISNFNSTLIVTQQRYLKRPDPLGSKCDTITSPRRLVITFITSNGYRV